MKYLEKAIEDAMGAGYVPSWIKESTTEHWFGFSQNQTMSISQTILDPQFWQCLGKSRGWEKRITFYNSFIDGKENNDQWRLEMHRFIDALAEGRTIESFFESLENKE